MTSRSAAYQVLAQDLRTAIFERRYPDGAKLPTEAVLAQQYGVSRQTVRRAFHDLVSEGMVTRVPGRGTFTAPRADGSYLRQFGSIEDLMGMSMDTTRQILRPLEPGVDEGAARRLELPGDTVHTLRVLRRHAGAPLCVTTVHLPPEIGASLERLPEMSDPDSTSNATAIGLLDTHLKLPVAEAEQGISAAAADDDTARHLHCRVRDPVLRIDRLYRTTDGIPVEWAISHFLPEHYTYRFRLRRTVR